MDDRKYNTQKQQKLLKQGRLQIIAYLSQMPRTSHYVNTFTMDVSLITEAMMLVKVSGMFKELDKKEQPIGYFNRTFTIIPEGRGYCIRDEQLHVTQPTEAQLKQENCQPNVQTRGAEANTVIPEVQMLEPKYQMTHPEEQISDPQAQMTDSQTSPVSSTTEPSPAPILEDIRQQMTMSRSQQTGMNLQWSLKCLQELSWDYDNVLSTFQTFQKQGQITVEAFSKQEYCI